MDAALEAVVFGLRHPKTFTVTVLLVWTPSHRRAADSSISAPTAYRVGNSLHHIRDKPSAADDRGKDNEKKVRSVVPDAGTHADQCREPFVKIRTDDGGRKEHHRAEEGDDAHLLEDFLYRLSHVPLPRDASR